MKLFISVLFAILFSNLLFSQIQNSDDAYREAVMQYSTGNYENALKYYSTLKDQTGKFKNISFNIGLCYYAMNEYTNAIEYFQKDLKFDSAGSAIYPYLAKCNKIIGKPRVAIDYYKKAIDKNPNDYTSLYELGINYFELKEYERAIYYFHNFILLKPNSFIGNHYLGLGYYSAEMPDSAITYFKKAIEINPDFIPSLNSIATCYYNQKNYDPAVLASCKSLLLDSSNAAAHRRLGDCLYAMEKYPEACVSYRNAKSYGDSSAFLINNLGWSFYRCQQYDSAIYYMRWLVNEDPKQSDRRINLAGMLFKTSKFEEAAKEFQAAVDILDDKVLSTYPDVYTRLGICLHQQKKYNEAVIKYKKAIEIKPDFSLAFYNLAVTLDVLDKNKKEAVKTYEKFLDLNKDNDNFQEYKTEAKERIKLLKSK